MTKKSVAGVLSIAVVACVAAVCIQGKEVSRLRSNRAELLQGSSTQPEPPEDSQQTTGVNSPAAEQQSELLRLRNEISQLNRRKLELAKASDENTRLKAELQAKEAKAKHGMVAGYIRQSEAIMSGFARPEDTLQTFLWALRRGDTNTLAETLCPDLRSRFEQGGLEGIKLFVGMGVTAKTNLPNGDIRLTVQVVSDLPTVGILFRDFNGAWKIERME